MFSERGTSQDVSSSPEISSLQKGFLQKNISAREFLERLHSFDQQDPERFSAEAISSLLHNEEIERLCLLEDEEDFFSLRCLVDFHVAQHLLFAERRDEARRYFTQALSDVRSDVPLDALYIQGTLAFLEKDLFSLRAILAQLSPSPLHDGRDNRHILLRMEQALEAQEFSYDKVYNSLPLV